MKKREPFVYLSGEQFALLTQAKKIAYLASAIAEIIRDDRAVVSKTREPDPHSEPEPSHRR